MKSRLAIVQHAYKGTHEKTLAYVLEKAEDSLREGAKILCLQELFAHPYFCQEQDPKYFECSQSQEGEWKDAFCELAKHYGAVIVLPFFERGMAGVYHNSVLVIDSEGEVMGVSRKHHIPDDPGFFEKYYFSPSEAPYQVYETCNGTLAVLICWDQWFPEAARIVSLMGAELILYPTAIGVLEGEASLEKTYRDAWKTIQRAAAIANGVFVASVNRVGKEGGIDFWGNSFVCGPLGEILTNPVGREETTLAVEMDFSHIESTRQTWPFLRDRRIDSYAPLLNRSLVL